MSFKMRLTLLMLGIMVVMVVVCAVCAYWEWNIRMADKAAERSRNERERKKCRVRETAQIGISNVTLHVTYTSGTKQSAGPAESRTPRSGIS